jgi:caffeoyl-CoA O-methyltransferase
MARHRREPWIDPDVADYATAHSTSADDIQLRLIAETAQRHGPSAQMQISPDEGVFLQLITKASGARHAVEVGTFTGYSALCIARALPADGTLLCCDVSEEWTAIGQRYWMEAEVADKIDLRIAPAIDTLRSLPADRRFDLAFIDADKPSYHLYYEEILGRMDAGGLILVDNTIWSGQVLDPDPGDADTMALAAFNDALATDDRVDVVVLTFRDGVTIARKR